MINKKTIQKYASMVLIDTVKDLFNNNKKLIDNFYEDLAKENKHNKNLKDNYKDNEVIDQLIIDELEKSFTQNDIGLALQTQMVQKNEEAIEELSDVLDEKFVPIAKNLKSQFKDDSEYKSFKKITTENLVVNNMDLNRSVIKALKTMDISGMKAAEIMQLIAMVN